MAAAHKITTTLEQIIWQFYELIAESGVGSRVPGEYMI